MPMGTPRPRDLQTDTASPASSQIPQLAIAAGSGLGAAAAETIARDGGNAVDACLAAGVMAWVAEPFFASTAGSGFIVVRNPGGEVEVIDGNNAMPHTQPTEPGQGLSRTFIPDYSDGMHTGIGAGSVAVPGILAAVHKAWERHGAIEWAALFQPAIDAARNGLPFPKTSAFYLSVTWKEIWSTFDSSRAMFSRDGRLLEENEPLIQGALANSLEAIAERGPEVFYEGELGAAMVEELASEGGFITLDDFKSYSADIRQPITTEAFGWKVESNPPPAVGGAVLTHMLALLDETDLSDPKSRLSAIVEAQRASMGYRHERYDDPGDIAGALEEAMSPLRRRMQSPSTTHSSSADADGYACSLTESNGYGAGIVIKGILMNNTLGEEELNPLGVHSLPPGSRMHSNMAPTIVTGEDSVVALGSPGADRIVSALAQTFIALAVDGLSLEDAVAHPRAHLDPREEGEVLCFEPGLPGDELGYIPRPYDAPHMYFGGVQAASVTYDGVVTSAHDPRRSGSSRLI